MEGQFKEIMADLVFYCGAMGCGKTANALMTKFNYEQKGIGVWLIKPAIDDRSGADQVGSRIGLKDTACVIGGYDSVTTAFIKDAEMNVINLGLIVVDEAQFFSEEQINELRDISYKYDIPVKCYGLRTDSATKLFPGAKRLMEIADDVVMLDSVCSCGKHAIVNARVENGMVVAPSGQVEIGGDEKYKALCYSCWKKLVGKSDV